jgi:hypothetical protein
MAVAMRHYEQAAMHKSSVESFYSFDENEHHSQIAPPQPKHPARQVRPSQLRLQTDLNMQQPTTHRRYQSDEEVPSPSMEEDYSEGQNSSAEDVAIDESIDLDHIEPLSATAPIEEAQSVRIVFSGKPSLINVSRIAPMQRRRRPAIAAASHPSPPPQQPPVPIPRRSSRRRNRSISLYEPPVVVEPSVQPKAFATPNQPHFHADSTMTYIGTDPSANASSSYLSLSSRNSSVTNFSAPHRYTARPRLVEHNSASTASSSISTSSSPPPQFSRGPASPADTEPTEIDDDDVGDALMRESAEIKFRTQSGERERQLALAGEIEAGYYEDHDVLDEYHVEQGVPGYHVKHSSLDEDEYSGKKSLEGPTPTSYDHYDPYGMQPPSLGDSRGRRGSAAAVASAAKKGWKGLARAGRRRGAIAA